MNGELQLPQRTTIQPAPQMHTQKLLNRIKNMTQQQPDQQHKKNTAIEDTSHTTLETAISEDELIYADDTKLINEHDTPPQIIS